jgi:single-stranded-DNA-specific exonuclease RecJ
MPDQRWQIHPRLQGESQWLAQHTGLSPLLTQVLLNRGIDTVEAAQAFLNPESLLLPSPLEDFPDLAGSVELLVTAIETGQKIAICGDYDADGMTSTALLLRALRFLGADANYAIPSRMQEGYGINTRIVEDFYAEGVSLILTVDNGIAAVEPVAYARELGLTVIITDHHDVPPEVPPANAILNPKLIRADSPYRGVAGVGVAYILAVCLAQALGKTQDLTAPLLELFTLGTIADLAPLTGVNRRWVKRGLGLLPKSRIIGVQALIQVAGLSDQNKPLKPEDIGFRLGPRINAVGRISDPQIVIEMLTTDDVGLALERAMQCEQANQSRREMCDRIEEEAIAWCEAQQTEGEVDLVRDRCLLVIQPDWHHGVIGIVASRLVERYGVPVFIGTYEDEDRTEIRGSARGIPEFNVFDALQACHDLLGKFGGHKAAGGFSFPAKHLRQVKSRLVNHANATLAVAHLKPLVTVDSRAHLVDLTLDLYAQGDTLHPCGIENPDPVFWTPNVRIVEQRAMGKNRTHLKLSVTDGNGGPVEAIAWRWGHYCPLPSPVDIAYKLKLNEWRGQRTLQLELVGVRPATVPSPPPSPAPPPQAVQATTAATLTLPFENSGAIAPSSPLPSPGRSKGDRPPRVAEADASGLPAPASQASALERGEPLPPSLDPDPATALEPPLAHWPNSPGEGDGADGPPVAQVEFDYSRRQYTAQIFGTAANRELYICNPEGQTLAVMLPERQGYLCLPGQDPRPVDLGEAHYFNLIRAGMAALELRRQTRLLWEKDELLAEKDRHIAALTQQVQLLAEKLNHLSQEQQQQFQTLRQAIQTQETVIQTQEAHIATIQDQQIHGEPPPDPQGLKQTVRSRLGDALWFCLQTESQTDLSTAHKQSHLIRQGSPNPEQADYSAAALPLLAVVQREVVTPLFTDLRAYSAAHGLSPTLGRINLEAGIPTLIQVPPLLADRWQSYRAKTLKQATVPALEDLPVAGRSRHPLPGEDRDRLTDFLQQWEHPMAAWLLADPAEAAGCLDQIQRCGAIATAAKDSLWAWVWDRLDAHIMGESGLLQHIYGSKKYGSKK